MVCTAADRLPAPPIYLAIVPGAMSTSGMQAVGVIGMVAYLSYLVGDYIGLSGIVTLFCCSVTMSHYAMHNITKAQRAGTMSAFETLSFLSEGAIFVYVGLDALDPMKWKVISAPSPSAEACLVHQGVMSREESR